MPALKDRVGQRYGRLLVLERAPNGTHNRVMWKCQCDCGNICTVYGNNLQNGDTKSCGCLNTETRRQLGLSNRENLTGKKFGLLTVIEIYIRELLIIIIHIYINVYAIVEMKLLLGILIYEVATLNLVVV